MPYTPLIYFTPEVETKLLSYLREEIDNHNMERSGWVDSIKKWDTLYWGEPSAAASSGPLKWGATIVIPVIAIAVEMMTAKQITKLTALEQFSAIALPDEYADLDRDLEKILDHEYVTTAKIEDAIVDASLEFNKFGTTIMKNGYEYVTRNAIIYDAEGKKSEREVTVKQGLCIDAVRCANFLMPFYATDPQTSPWVGEERVSNPFEILTFSENGLFYEDTFNNLQNYFDTLTQGNLSPSASYLQNKERQEKRQPIWPKRVHWQEIWLSFQTDGSSKKREIVVYYHHLSNKLLGARYNYRHDLSRPYFTKSYFPVEGRWTGIGLCKMGDQFQVEITTQHRQRIDAANLANLRMFKAKRGTGISPDEPIFYGKIWMVDEMDDLEMFTLNEVYPSAYQNEQAANLWWQQRSTVNELSLGQPSVGTPGTAAGELERVRENGMRFDFTYNRLKSLVKDVCLDSICIIGQYGIRHPIMFNTIKSGDKVKQFLSLDPALIKDEVLLKFDLAGQSKNKLVDRASWTQLAGMLTQYYTNLIQLSSQLGAQELTATISQRAMSAATEAMKQILESYDVRNIEKLILQLEAQNAQPSGGIGEIPSGIAGLVQSPGQGLVNPIYTTVGG